MQEVEYSESNIYIVLLTLTVYNYSTTVNNIKGNKCGKMILKQIKRKHVAFISMSKVLIYSILLLSHSFSLIWPSQIMSKKRSIAFLATCSYVSTKILKFPVSRQMLFWAFISYCPMRKQRGISSKCYPVPCGYDVILSIALSADTAWLNRDFLTMSCKTILVD